MFLFMSRLSKPPCFPDMSSVPFLRTYLYQFGFLATPVCHFICYINIIINYLFKKCLFCKILHLIRLLIYFTKQNVLNKIFQDICVDEVRFMFLLSMTVRLVRCIINLCINTFFSFSIYIAFSGPRFMKMYLILNGGKWSSYLTIIFKINFSL